MSIAKEKKDMFPTYVGMNRKVLELPGGVPVMIDRGFFIDKITGEWKVQKDGREQYVRQLAQTILNPYEIWEVPAQVAGKRLPVLRLLRMFSLDERKIGGFVVFNLVSGRYWQAATAFTPKTSGNGVDTLAMLGYLNRQRQSVLVYREDAQVTPAP